MQSFHAHLLPAWLDGTDFFCSECRRYFRHALSSLGVPDHVTILHPPKINENTWQPPLPVEQNAASQHKTPLFAGTGCFTPAGKNSAYAT
jgi:hypothetical protein